MSRRLPAYAERWQYGEPCSSGGPSGSVCHTLKPPAASQSTKAHASRPNVPCAPKPGSEVGWSKTPARRAARTGFIQGSARRAAAQGSQHGGRHEHDAVVRDVKVKAVGLPIAADHRAVRNDAAFVDDRVLDVTAPA